MLSEDLHKAELEDLRADRNNIRAKNSLIIKDTEELLKSFDVDDGCNLITFESLKALIKGEVYEVNDSVSFVMKSKSENRLVFITYMLEGGSFGLQEHDCFEFCEIIDGNLFETERGYKVYVEGEVVSYSPNEKHKPYSTTNSIYEVTFIKEL